MSQGELYILYVHIHKLLPKISDVWVCVGVRLRVHEHKHINWSDLNLNTCKHMHIQKHTNISTCKYINT